MLAGKWLSAPPHSFGRYLQDSSGIRKQGDAAIMYGGMECYIKDELQDGEYRNLTILPLVLAKV